MKYFITGGAGFLGSHVVDRLMEQGAEVTVYDNLSFGKKEHLASHLDNPRFKFFQKDLLELKDLSEAMEGHDFVFHLAANSDIMRAMNDPTLDFRQGVQVTFHVLEAMRAHQVGKLVYFSGSGIYGDFGNAAIGEKDAGRGPESMYGAAKLSSEAMIHAYSHLYNIQAWVFRPANVIGARPTHGVIYDFIRKLKASPEELKVLGSGYQDKSYIYETDLLDAVFFAVSKASEKINCFNVANETSLNVRGIAEMVIQKMGLDKVKVLYEKELRGWKGDIPICRLSIEKLKQLGWKPKYTSEQAIAKTIEDILQSEKSS